MRLTIQKTPYSSIVGGGLTLCDEAGRARFLVMFCGTTAGITKEETAALTEQFSDALPNGIDVPESRPRRARPDAHPHGQGDTMSDRRISETLLEKMCAALGTAIEAINTWIATYASEMCSESEVAQAQERIVAAGGTLAYAADTNKQITDILSRLRALPAAEPGWRTMDSAPRDGTPIQAMIPGHGSDNVIAWTDTLVDSNDEDCGGWQFVTEQEPPDDWTDGICWSVNEDGKPSTQPTLWQPLPAPPGAAAPAEPAGLDEATIRACIEVVRTEEEMDGDPPQYVLDSMMAVDPIANARSAVRATKRSIEQRIRALSCQGEGE